MKFTERYKINIHDEGFNGIISPTGYLRYIQDCANCQMESDGPSYTELFESGLSFILSRVKIVFHKELYSHDSIDVSTWACTPHGATFPRCYEITRNGEICAEAKAVWALFDVNKKRLCRADNIALNYRTDAELNIEMPRVIKPIGEFEKVGEKEVVFADADINRHMNNTVYADMFWNYVPDLFNARPASIDIFYKSEAPLGSRLEIFRTKSEKGYFMKSVKENGTINAEVEIRLMR